MMPANGNPQTAIFSFFSAHPHTAATVAAAIPGCRIARLPSRVVWLYKQGHDMDCALAAKWQG